MRTTGGGDRLGTEPLKCVLEEVRESNDESTLADKGSHTVLTVGAEIPRSLVRSLVSRTRFRFRSRGTPNSLSTDHLVFWTHQITRIGVSSNCMRINSKSFYIALLAFAATELVFSLTHGRNVSPREQS